jgi:hypothetical protein
MLCDSKETQQCYTGGGAKCLKVIGDSVRSRPTNKETKIAPATNTAMLIFTMSRDQIGWSDFENGNDDEDLNEQTHTSMTVLF